jgi:predicted secreted acid phosphatase
MRVAKKKLLLVLDINGTLLDRIKGSEYKHARTNAHCPDSHDTTINKHKSLYILFVYL